MEADELRRLLIERAGIRVEREMSEYLLGRFGAASGDAVPVIGGDARTGVPVRRMIGPGVIRPGVIRLEASER